MGIITYRENKWTKELNCFCVTSGMDEATSSMEMMDVGSSGMMEQPRATGDGQDLEKAGRGWREDGGWEGEQEAAEMAAGGWGADGGWEGQQETAEVVRKRSP